MYIRKDIHKSLRSEARIAEDAGCFAWAKLFRECAWLLRKTDRENERLRAALEPFAKFCEEMDALPHCAAKPDEAVIHWPLTVGAFRAALAAWLEAKGARL